MCNAYISSFAYCREIKTTSNEFGDVNQITILPYLKLDTIPKIYSLKAMCVIAGINFNQDNFLDVYFIAPDGNVLIKHSHEVLLAIIKKYAEKMPEAILLQIDLATNFKQKGIYTTKVILNDNCIGIFKINITESDMHD